MCTSERGLSLIELLVFIVVVGIAVTGVLSVFSFNARTSADPMVRKQALAIAESLLEEVLAQPYTYCDPDDANVETASSPGDCAVSETAMAREPGESRGANLKPLDNVNDYNGYPMPVIAGPDGNAVPNLNGYSASVQVQPVANFNGIVPAPGDNETLLVTVTVNGPGNQGVTLSGYRTRYAPNF